MSLSLGRGRGAKRTQSELADLQQRIYAFVSSHPGLRVEQINEKLGTSTRELQRPVRALVLSGALTTKGAKRSTTYFAGRAPRLDKAEKSERAASGGKGRRGKGRKTRSAKKGRRGARKRDDGRRSAAAPVAPDVETAAAA